MRVLVSGSSGRMSKRIISLMANDKEIEAVYAIEKKNHKDIGKKLTEIVGIEAKNIDNEVTDDIKKVIETIDVVIEFTTPKATLDHIEEAKKHKKAIVIGTTGFNKEEFDEIKDASFEIPVFISPNMSIGVNLVFNLLRKISKSLPLDYDVEIIETHHKFKKDAPSGTAKKMAKIIAEARDQNPDEVIIYGRRGHTDKKPDNQICIHALRGGSVIGRHQVKFISDEDEIEIIHSASSRDVFAKGAILAAKFINKKKKGLFTTEDII